MGHVSCNTAADIDNSEVEVSSPMGHVSCNLYEYNIKRCYYVSSPMGHVSCNKMPSKTEKEVDLFRPLWGM